MTDYNSMSPSQQVAAFNTMVEDIKTKGVEITPVKRFKSHSIGTERCNKLEAKLIRLLSEELK